MGAGATLNTDPWLACEQQLSARLLLPLLRFYERQFGRPALVRLATELGTTLEVLEDPDRWFSAALFLELELAMVAATRDPQITWRAGRALAAPGMLGPERLLMVGLLSPRRVYEGFSGITARYSRITRWEMTALGRGSLRAEFVPVGTAPDHALFCANRRGVLEAVPEIFGLPTAHVDHPVCLHRGDDRCVYQVHWSERPPWTRPALVGALSTSLTALFAWSVDNPYDGPLLAAAIGFGVLGVVGLTRVPVSANVRSLGGESAAELQDLIDRSARRVHELQALQRVIESTRDLLDEDALVDEVLTQLTGVLGYGRAALVRAEGDTLRVSARGDLHGDWAPAMARALGQSRARVLDVASSGLAPDDTHTLLAAGFRSLVLTPLVGSRAPIGFLVVDRPGGDTAAHPTQRDRDLIESVAATAGAALGNARLYRQVQEELLINRKFRQYLPTEVADEVLRDPGAAARIGGREESLVVLFCDIAGFTRLSSVASASEVVHGLNLWFELADPAITAERGIIDKRMGDGILVVFREGGDHPVVRAVRASLAMQAVLTANRARFTRDAPSFAHVEVRHAIHYGRAILGNIGSASRIEYTVIGDAVNTAARLEELTPAGEVWLTEDAVNAAPPGALPPVVRVGDVILRGRSQPTGLWRVEA